MSYPGLEAIAAGLPVYGTCAGLILLAKKIEGEPSQRIASMDITALRNAYGRQLGSFYIEAPMKGIEGNIPMTFIRAPYIKEVWGDAEVLAEVSIAQENIIKIIDTVLFDFICCMSSNICCGFLILRQMYVKLSIIAIE